MAEITQNFVNDQVLASLAVKQAIYDAPELLAQIKAACDLMVQTYRGGGKALLGGNGGSAADAQHIAAEFVARFYMDRPGLPAIAMTTDPSVVTAVSNDYGFDALFKRQLQASGRPGDVFIAISTSGNSPNVLEGLRACGELGLQSIGLTGRTGGAMAELCDHCICVPSDDTPRIQESHILIGHILCSAVEQSLFGSG